MRHGEARRGGKWLFLSALGFHPAPFFFWVLGAAESRPVGYNRRLVETYGIPTRALAIRTDSAF